MILNLLAPFKKEKVQKRENSKNKPGLKNNSSSTLPSTGISAGNSSKSINSGDRVLKTTMATSTKHSTNQAIASRDFKHRVLSCLTKLSDRDTYSAAATELESIAKTLNHDSIPPFLSSITTSDSSDKSPVRKQCVRLISILSESHGNLLSPHLSKILASVICRLCDSDSAVRSTCISAIGSISSHITKPPFTLIAKPLVDALVTAQELNYQIGAALCLAAAIDGSPDPEPVYLKKLLPRLEKLLRSECFKAKAALLSVFGSVIGVNGALSQQGVRNSVNCFIEFLSCDDWAARKAAAEALGKLATVERSMMIEYKASTLKTFEAKRFDKVKVVRETMNEMAEAWRGIPDVFNEVSPTPKSQSSPKEVANNGHYPPSSKSSNTSSSGAPQLGKNYSLARDSPLSDDMSFATSRKRSPLGCSIDKAGPAMFRKLDGKKPFNQKIDAVAPVTDVSVDSNEKKNKFDFTRVSARVLPYDDHVSTLVARNVTEDVYKNQKECEDLSLIHKQLIHIENQQSSLLDILQGYIVTSRNGMLTLESRVHGLELALDEISYELAVSTGRMPNTNSAGAMCCKIPGAEFIGSKFWRRTNSSLLALQTMADKNSNTNTFKQEDRRFGLQGSRGFIVNPLAEVQNFSQGISDTSSNRMLKNLHGQV